MEQILKDLLSPELREALAREEFTNALEQKKFDEALAGRAQIPYLTKNERKHSESRRRNLVVQHAVCNALGRSR